MRQSPKLDNSRPYLLIIIITYQSRPVITQHALALIPSVPCYAHLPSVSK